MKVTTRHAGGAFPLLDHHPPTVWISPEVSLVGWGEAFRFVAGTGSERFDRAERAFGDWLATVQVDDRVRVPGSGPVAFSSFTFDARSSGSVLIVPEVVFGVRDRDWFVTTVGDVDPCPFTHPAGTADPDVDRPRYAGASVPDVGWMEAVAEVTRLISEGQVEKVVLARDYAVWSKHRFDSKRVLTNLLERFPECFVFTVDGLVGASPELLVRKTDRRVESVALAGSARRGREPDEDEILGKELSASDKDRREHEMVSTSVGQVLGEVCESLNSDTAPELLKLENVQHLATRFDGVLSPAVGIFELISRLHPTAAVGGVPSDRAIELIRALEGMDRGRYAGPVGWVDSNGDGEVAIALRCAEVSGARARLFAGAGIVEGSLPEAELEETRLKLMAMLSALE